MLPEALDALLGEERRRLYGMLRLGVAPAPNGVEITGALSTSGPRRISVQHAIEEPLTA
jgi:hypothetical protein